jgi:hypothetical protein
MGNESSQARSNLTRIIDITIASLVGGILGAVIAWPQTHPSSISVDSIYTRHIRVDGDLGFISIDEPGISLYRNDYAQALLWFHEPGTGSPGKGGPALWMVGKEAQAFKATPLGQETITLKRNAEDEDKKP